MRNRYEVNFGEIRQLIKKISKEIRKDIRNYNTERISQVIEDNKSMKVLRRKLNEGTKNICRLKNKRGEIKTNRDDILKIAQDFYAELYERSRAPNLNQIPRVQNVGSEDIPDISKAEIERALAEIKNNKSPGEDEIVIEAIKEGGASLKSLIQKMFNACLTRGITPSQWHNAIITIMHKKGDITDLKNYRPISLLSHTYKLFIKIITKSLINKLGAYEPCKQAGFRSGYGTNDHLQVIKSLIEKCIEYNKPIVLIFVDYEKAFDTIDQHEMLLALADCRIDYRYIALIKNVYDTATASVRLHEDTKKFRIERGVRQGDVISPKLFTAVLQYMFKKMNIEDNMGININEEDLNHLRFADDIVIISDCINKARKMLERLHQISGRIGPNL